MAIYYYTSAGIIVTPTPSAAAASAYFGNQDVYITLNGAILRGLLGSPAGKIGTPTYDPNSPFIGLTGGFFPGSGTSPPVVPPVTVTPLDTTKSAAAGQPLNFTPLMALGGTAVGATASGNKSSLAVSITPALPSGLTLYTSKTNIVAGTVKPTQTSDFKVTYTITSNTGITPVVGQFYAVRGQTKVTYNGIWECTAVTPTSIELKYNADPSAGGGVNPTGQLVWSTTAVTTITDADVYALPRTDGSTNKDWYNYTSVTIGGTPLSGDTGKNYTVTFTDGKGQTASGSFNLTITGGTVATPLSASVDIATRTSTQGTADSFKPVSGAGGTAPLKYTIAPVLPTGLSIDLNTGTISGTPTAYSVETEYTITVTDAAGATSTGKFKLTVLAPSITVTAAQPSTYLYQFTRTIPITSFKPATGSGGYGTLSYSAASLPAGLSINSVTGYISGTGTSVVAASLYSITVTDSNTPVASNASTSIRIAVADLPVLTTTLSQPTYTLTKNSQNYSFTPVTGNGGYGTKSYDITGTVSLSSIGLSFNNNTGLISGNPTGLIISTDFTVIVSDQAIPPQTSSKTFKIEVIALALSTTLDVSTPPPGIKNVAISSFRPVSASGGDGSYTFSISPNIVSQTGLTFNTSTGYISGTPTIVDAVDTYTVTVTDQTTPSPQTSSKSFTYRVDAPPILIISAITEKILTQYDTFTAFIPVVGIGGYGTLAYTISPTLPGGLTFSSGSGEIAGPATRYLVTATLFTVTVNDQALQSTSSNFLLTVKTRPLVVKTDERSKTFIRDVNATSYKPVSATGGSETYSYEIGTSLPSGLLFNTSTGFISGKPTTTSTTATYSVTITDTLNTSGASTFELGVIPPPPIVTTSLVSSSTFYKASTVVNLSPVGASGGYGSITFSINPDINADTGLTFSGNGLLSGTVPSSKSNFSNRVYTISATDSIGQSSSTNYTVTVSYVPLSITRVVASSTFTRNKAITSYIPATSANGSGGISFTISPDIYANIGLNFDVSIGRIYGTPSSTCTNTVYTITAQDSDSNTASTTTNITVNNPIGISTTATSSSFTLIVGQSASFTPVTASGGDGVIKFIIGPDVPLGLTFDKNNGSITGNPVTTSTTATYVVTATDALLQSSSSNFKLDIRPQPISISTPYPTVVYTIYEYKDPFKPVVATGGFGSLRYDLTPSTLPAGLTYNSGIGEISGAPSAVTTTTGITYSVTVSDSLGQTNSGTFVLTVNDVVHDPLSASALGSVFTYIVGQFDDQHPVNGAGGIGTYTYAISPLTLPTGLSFSTITGNISGTPTANFVSSPYVITITDGAPVSESASFNIEVITQQIGSGKGYAGSRGYSGSIGIGYAGSRGSIGYAGSIGYTGSTGAGYVGSASTQTGYTGSIGYAGSTGAGYVGSASTQTGYTGSIGYAGSTGAGYVGSASTQTGYTGSRGYDGSIGYTGSLGDTGDPGETGYVGSRGDIGLTGNDGSDGSDGATGYVGSASTETGYTGSIGYVGSQGNTGYIGSASTQTGYTGSIGYTSSIGYVGSKGDKGNDGTSVKITGSTSTFALLPVPYTGDIGDGYILTDTGHLAVWLGSPTNWEDVGNVIGYTGSIGYSGSIGVSGYTGSIGYAGSYGYIGSKGESSYTYADIPPESPVVGDRWFDSSSGLEFVWTDDGNSTQWIEIAASGFIGNTGYVGSSGDTGPMGPLHLTIAITDETSVISNGSRQVTFRAPFGMMLTSIPRASLGYASSSGDVVVDVIVDGTSILGTSKLSIDAGEKTSKTATTPTTLATSTIADDAEITFDIVSSGNNATGLKVTMYYSRA